MEFVASGGMVHPGRWSIGNVEAINRRAKSSQPGSGHRDEVLVKGTVDVWYLRVYLPAYPTYMHYTHLLNPSYTRAKQNPTTDPPLLMRMPAPR